ncbi:MAG TPA: molybdopterin cofactor-binding domain-containing protein, partial [Thermoanaerobaculia bacterium]
MLHHTRRAFMKSMTVGTTAVVVLKWPPALDAAPPPGDPVQPPPSTGWGPVAGQARYRIDGIPKVTGEKIYARDFAPGDIPLWPKTAMYVSLLKAVRTDREFVKVNLSKLPAALQPVKTVLQSDLDAASIKTPWFDGINFSTTPPLLVEPGSVPIYLGQPVAMLFFDDQATWRAAERLMQLDPDFIEYGAKGTPKYSGMTLGDPYYFIRYSDDGTEVFSQVTAQASLDPAGTTPADIEAKKVQELIDKKFRNAPAEGWRVFESTTATQTIDPMFMEPQTGMAYMRRAGVANQLELDLVVGTQSPNADVATLCNSVLQGTANHPDYVRMYSCYPGGGFGGRDTSLFTYFLGIAAAFSIGRPIRLEFDRFGQFQSGIKRNGSQIEQQFAVDKEGKLQAIRSSITIVGGGKMNYSPFVAELAGICGAGSYAVPMNDIKAVARQTIGPTAGSMRGFGGPQAFFAVEHLMDEIAAGLKLDPIELRLRNVLERGDYNVCGAPLTEPLALREICELARATPLWRNRDDERRRRSDGDTIYGVGFALANQAYGTGTDPVLGNVSLEPDGKVTVTTTAVDMGNGSATSLALATARWLGTNASAIEMGGVDFATVLNLTSSSTASPCAPGTITPICSPLDPSEAMAAAWRGGHAKRATATATATAAAPPSASPWDNP